MRKAKRWILVCFLLLAFGLIIFLLTKQQTVNADDGWTWTLEDGCLTISGQGEMLYGWRPWEGHRKEITRVVFSEGVTKIAFFAFSSNYENLTHVTLPSSLEKIGGYAFKGCPNLKRVTFRGSALQASRLEIGEGNDILQQVPWEQGSGYLLLRSFLITALSVGAQLLLIFLIIRFVEWRRLRQPKEFFWR